MDKNIIQTFKELGFQDIHYDEEYGSYFGSQEAEAYDVGKNHFKPFKRIVYISSNMYPKTIRDFVYITSTISGNYRGYRCKNWYETEVGNIFASGKTINKAVTAFKHNFERKIYNKS